MTPAAIALLARRDFECGRGASGEWPEGGVVTTLMVVAPDFRSYRATTPRARTPTPMVSTNSTTPMPIRAGPLLAGRFPELVGD